MTSSTARNDERSERPLHGILVLDFSQFLSGSLATLRLADMGARVIKIERPGAGDLCRTIYLSDTDVDGENTLFHAINRNSVVEFSRSGQEEIKQGRGSGRKTGTFEMTFTGTLIDDLMAAVERAEQTREALLVEAAALSSSFSESALGQSSVEQSWFASVQENAEYDPKFLGVA